jgi:hypothetical protein
MRIIRFWTAASVNRFKKERCGQINCRSRLEKRNPVQDEIQEIIDSRSGGRPGMPRK